MRSRSTRIGPASRKRPSTCETLAPPPLPRRSMIQPLPPACLALLQVVVQVLADRAAGRADRRTRPGTSRGGSGRRLRGGPASSAAARRSGRARPGRRRCRRSPASARAPGPAPARRSRRRPRRSVRVTACPSSPRSISETSRSSRRLTSRPSIARMTSPSLTPAFSAGAPEMTEPIVNGAVWPWIRIPSPTRPWSLVRLARKRANASGEPGTRCAARRRSGS